jgi:hypothetical protein
VCSDPLAGCGKTVLRMPKLPPPIRIDVSNAGIDASRSAARRQKSLRKFAQSGLCDAKPACESDFFFSCRLGPGSARARPRREPIRNARPSRDADEENKNT